MTPTVTAVPVGANPEVGFAIFVAAMLLTFFAATVILFAPSYLWRLVAANLFGRMPCGACDGRGWTRDYGKINDRDSCRWCDATGFRPWPPEKEGPR